MARLPYSALDSDQRSQVGHLFADQFFGVDATGFEYEVSGGMVTGRMTMDEGQKTKSKRGGEIVVCAQEDGGRDIVNLYMSADQLVAILARKINQFEEVHHE